jgi:hypothetical protein
MHQLGNSHLERTGKTNTAGHEFYAIVGEANGQAIPMVFAFMAPTDGSAVTGAKDHILQDVLEWVSKLHQQKFQNYAVCS